MSRISLVEAYDNRDVIGQLVRLREDVNELQNILKDINPSGDLTNVVTKTGDQVIDGIKTFVGKIVADCDIIQNGAAYETHAEQVYSKNDYIVMRDEAVAGLAPGTYSGLHVKKYNGVDDARLVVDRDGVARVGDVNDEQPLLTRDEVTDMTSGNILSWDGVNKKAITSGKSVSDLNTDIAAKVSGTGNIGSDTKPVKIVNGEATAVLQDLVPNTSVCSNMTVTGADVSGTVGVTIFGKVVTVSIFGSLTVTSTGQKTLLTGLPEARSHMGVTAFAGQSISGFLYMDGTSLKYDASTTSGPYVSLTYISV